MSRRQYTRNPKDDLENEDPIILPGGEGQGSLTSEEELEAEEEKLNENVDVIKSLEDEKVLPDEDSVPEGIENTEWSDLGMEKEGEDLETGESEPSPEP